MLTRTSPIAALHPDAPILITRSHLTAALRELIADDMKRRGVSAGRHPLAVANLDAQAVARTDQLLDKLHRTAQDTSHATAST